MQRGAMASSMTGIGSTGTTGVAATETVAGLVRGPRTATEMIGGSAVFAKRWPEPMHSGKSAFKSFKVCGKGKSQWRYQCRPSMYLLHCPWATGALANRPWSCKALVMCCIVTCHMSHSEAEPGFLNP